MPGRHASAPSRPRRRGLRGVVLGVVAAAAILTAGIVVAPRVLSSADGCAGSAHLRVAADPSIAPVVEGRARALMAADGEFSAAGTCLTVEVGQVDDATGIQQVADGAADLWIPRTLDWSPVSADADAVENLGSVAVSPLVVVASRDVASAIGWPDAEFSWTSVLGGDAGAVLTDPVTTPEGRATLSAIQSVVGPDADQTELVQVLTQVARNTAGTVSDALAATGAETPVFTAVSEQAVVQSNAAGEYSVVALYPREGTYAFDYPALVSTSTTIARPVVQAFVDELASEEAAEALREAGLRTPDGTAAESAGLVDGTTPAMPALLPDPDPEALSGIMRQWSALAIDMRMLAVIDVSGSMEEPVEDGGATRIELTRDAAKSALGLLPPASEVGMWAFSIEQDPPDDYVELVSVGPLEETVDDTTRLQALASAADELPSITTGGTGLNDTVLAAFQHMRANYDPDKINSVVLLTDGRNQDDPNGISTEVLLDTLRSQFDPAKPIPIITIGMSEEADMEALQDISEATGTKAYRAEDPRDIEQVFLQAMIERQCRPNC